jgi:hypothetical protein
MANKFGFNSEIIVDVETAYGKPTVLPVIYTATMTKHNNLALNWDPGIAKIESEIRNSSLAKSDCSLQAGRKMPTVTITGDLTLQNSLWLFQGICVDTTVVSPFTIQDIQGALYSYKFIKIDTANDKADILYGCVMESLSITREGDKYTFSANYRAQDFDTLVDISGWTATDPVVEPVAVCEDLALFTATAFMGSVTNIFAYTLTLTNSFVDDDKVFLGADTKSKEVCIGTAGTLELSYNVTSGDEYSSNILGITTTTVNTITTGTATSIQLITTGKITNNTEPDPGKDMYIGTMSIELLKGAGTVEPITVTIDSTV